MPKINKANRQVCDVDIRDAKTKKPIMLFDTANTTTQNISGDAVYATAKGARRIAFANPMQGTITIEAQVYPFEFYSLMSDGIIESTASFPVKEVITAVEDSGSGGAITLTISDDVSAQVDNVFVFNEGDFGGTPIAGTISGKTFTPTNTGDLVKDKKYEVGYIVKKSSGLKRISFNNNKLPSSYYISMNTVDKDENDLLTAYKIIIHKAQPQRNFELSQSSEGDPRTLTMTFDILEDKDGNYVDMIEFED